jgi:hypothetical protein
LTGLAIAACETSISNQACCTACCITKSPSMVVTRFPATLEIGVTQDLTASPLMCTVQAPHTAMPQPYLVPRRLRTSRTTHRSGMSNGTSKVVGRPFTINLTSRHYLGASLQTVELHKPHSCIPQRLCRAFSIS